MTDQEDESSRGEKLRKRAEYLADKALHGARWIPPDVAMDALTHELNVHHIELELQNDELRSAQVDLETSRSRYFALFELAPVGYCTLDSHGRIAEANNQLAKLLGVPQTELLGKPLTAFIDAADQDAYYLRAKVAARLEPVGLELRMLRREQPAFWAWLDSRTVADGEDGRVELLAINDIDALKHAEAVLERRVAERTSELERAQQAQRDEIARRKASELQLAQSESQLRAILDGAAAGIVATDQTGTLKLFNRAAEGIFGWKAEEVIGQDVSLLLAHEARAAHLAGVARYIETGERKDDPAPRRARAARKDGTTFPIEVSVSEVKTEASVGFTGIIRDLTQRQLLEEQLRQAQKMEAIARLASGISHDFNNLLMGIIGCTHAVRDLLPANHIALGPLDEIKGAAQHGATLTRQLLSYGRQQSRQFEPMPVNDTVRTIASLLKKVLGEDIQLEVELCAAPAVILGDPVALEQVLMNLAINARDAMKDGGRLRLATREVVRATVTHTRSGPLAPGSYVELVVEDSGTGMAPEALEHLFEPFFTTKPPGEGTGLGLYSVYGIVEQLAGGLDVASELGRGTRFTLLLPSHAQTAVVRAPQAPRPAEVTQRAKPGPRRTVLVVEDEYLIRFAVKHMLNPAEFELLMAVDFADAQRVAQEHAGAIDVLLTDIVLPAGSGGALAEWLRTLRPDVHVVFMSAYPASMLIEQRRIPPGTTSLQKPFDETQLRQALRSGETLH